MITQRRTQLILAAILGVSIFVLVVLAWATPDTVAQGPPLPTPTNVSSGGGSGGGGSDNDDDDDDHRPIGAYIALQVQPASSELWTVVQWQDSAGGWHDVEGWRGTLDSSGYRRWWVAAKDFNTGPFWWVVKRGANGPVVGTSDPFTLPGQANSTLQVSVSLNGL